MTFVWVVVGAAAVAVLYAAFSYNRLIRLRNRIEAAWAQIDVQLRRRYDLIPNLVETVKAYAVHERDTLEAVIAARNEALGASGVGAQAKAETKLTGALRGLLAVGEAYPELRANDVFAHLQEELSGTEGRIAYARQHYNDTVERHNTTIQSFPGVFIARALGFQPREYFQADDASRGPLRVEL